MPNAEEEQAKSLKITNPSPRSAIMHAHDAFREAAKVVRQLDRVSTLYSMEDRASVTAFEVYFKTIEDQIKLLKKRLGPTPPDPRRRPHPKTRNDFRDKET